MIGTRMVVHTNDFFFTRTRYSRCMMSPILFMTSSLNGLKLTGQRRAFYQLNEYIAERWQYFMEGVNACGLLQEILQYMVGRMSFADLDDQFAFSLANDLKGIGVDLAG